MKSDRIAAQTRQDRSRLEYECSIREIYTLVALTNKCPIKPWLVSNGNSSILPANGEYQPGTILTLGFAAHHRCLLGAWRGARREKEKISCSFLVYPLKKCKKEDWEAFSL
jgi:hypothetical protein